MATDPVAADTMTLDRNDGSATLDLYRAALGPLHTDYYLKAFTRFDAAGKAGPSWNWGAALLTLNWMLLRKLWAPALAYVGALAACLLLLFGIGRLVFQLSDTSQWALLALAALLALMLPGAYGNAWLFAACNKKMQAALTASATLEEACALLSQNACTRKHLGGLAAGNLTLLAAIAAIVLSWPSSSALPLKTSKMEQARLATVATAESGLAAQSVAALAASASAPASASGPAPAPAPAASVAALADPASPALATPPITATSAPLTVAALASQPSMVVVPTRSSQGRVQAALPVAVSASLPLSAPASASASAAAPAAAPMPATAMAKSASAPLAIQEPIAQNAKPSKPSKAELRAKALLAKREKLAQAKEAKAAAARLAAKPKAEPASATTGIAVVPAASVAPVAPVAPSSSAAAPGAKFLINVGLFADVNNARNAYTKLQDAGLPALSQELQSAKGLRTRVRAGPFESQAEADSAAEKIRALRLDAAVVKP